MHGQPLASTTEAQTQSPCSLKVCPHYAAQQNATRCGFAIWQKLLGICRKIDHIHIKEEFFTNYISVYKNWGPRNTYASYAAPKMTCTLQLTANIGAANLWWYRHFADRIFMLRGILQHAASWGSHAGATPHWRLHYFQYLPRGEVALCCILPHGIVWSTFIWCSSKCDKGTNGTLNSFYL